MASPLLSASDIQVRKVSASKTTNLRGNDYDVELSHDLSEGESKIKMSTVLGAGVKAIGNLSPTRGRMDRREWANQSPASKSTPGRQHYTRGRV